MAESLQEEWERASAEWQELATALEKGESAAGERRALHAGDRRQEDTAGERKRPCGIRAPKSSSVVDSGCGIRKTKRRRCARPAALLKNYSGELPRRLQVLKWCFFEL
eukprot:SAG11_NODE_11945_length_730_cov_1.031696_1_plen_107_part_01